MANFVGAIEQFNPYIQQIPTEAYTKVGMFKEQQYQAGLEKIQNTVDQVAGLDIANEGGRQYLRARVDELTKTLNKYSQVDFSNPNNVTQLASLAKPLYQDENIVNDVINTGIYRKWAKDAGEAFRAGKMELGQYVRESSDANRWLTSQSAGADYTGRQAPNTATKQDLVNRIIKAKKDGLEKNEYVYDQNYSKDTPYYVKSTNKYYSEADFNNFITNNIMDSADREVLMNEHWYENQGVPIEVLQQEDIAQYQSKINQNNQQIAYLTEYAKTQASDDKMRTEQTIQDLQKYNTDLANGKIKFLQELNLADPQARDVFHRDLAETRFVDSMQILRDETKKEELQKNEQWFLEKGKELDATLEAIKNANKGTTATGKKGNPKNLNEIADVTDEVSVFTPVDPNAPKTELSLNTIQNGWTMKNNEITDAMNGLIGKLQENGVNVNQFIAGWDQVQVGTKAGAAKNVPRFKNEAAKQQFYNLVAGLDFAYTKEAADGHMDNQSFRTWLKTNLTDFRDEDPNSKFTFADKAINDAMNTMRGTSALLPKLDKLFADKGVVKALAQIDQSIKNKKDMANVYREAILKSNALTAEEQRNIQNISDDDLMNKSYILDKEKEEKRYGDKNVVYRIHQEGDGTYSIYQDVFNKDNDKSEDYMRYNRGGLKIPSAFPDYDPTKEGVAESRKIVGGYTDYDEAYEDANAGGSISALKGISEKSLKKAEDFVKQTYSYVQENLNTTVTNLKQDEPAYGAIKDGLTLFINRAKLQATPEDLLIDGGVDPKTIGGIKNLEVLGASVSNSEDIFTPNPTYEVQFTASVPNKDGELKDTLLNARVSLKSFLATNPNYKTSEYAKYFAPMLYAQQDAYARIKSTINPLEGSEGSYRNRNDIRPVYNYTDSRTGASNFAYDEMSNGEGNALQWETIPVEKDGKTSMISYQVVSLGQNTDLGNIKNKDGQQYQPGAYYVKLKVPTSTGQPKIIFLKKPNGESFTFNSAAYANYTLRDLILNNPDIKMDEVDPRSGEVNYLTTDPSTLRGILNSQLSYNGYSKLDTIKIKDALGKEIEKQVANQMQVAK